MKRLLPILAIVGFAVAVAVVMLERQHQPAKQSASTLQPAPYAQQVAGLGTIEAGSQDVAIGTPISGIVAAIDVKPGDRVQAGDVLARMDDRDVQARLVSATARVAEARDLLARAQHELIPAEALAREHVIGQVELTRRRDDAAVSRASVEVSEAQVGELRAEIERRLIRAPVSGRILRVNLHPGELAAADPAAAPLMVIGDDQALLVRVEIDERDASRVAEGASAVATPRGNPQVRMPLRFVRIEPYVAPKSVLAGRSGERTDVRVLQVVFSLDRTDAPVYVGQQVDVLIDATGGARAR
jgi:RND family efflux transporter MFP subunit